MRRKRCLREGLRTEQFSVAKCNKAACHPGSARAVRCGQAGGALGRLRLSATGLSFTKTYIWFWLQWIQCLLKAFVFYINSLQQASDEDIIYFIVAISSMPACPSALPLSGLAASLSCHHLGLRVRRGLQRHRIKARRCCGCDVLLLGTAWSNCKGRKPESHAAHL